VISTRAAPRERRFQPQPVRAGPGLVLILAWLTVLLGCASPTPEFAGTHTVTVSLTADGTIREITTQATSVRELLEEVDLTLNSADLIDPPPFTPLTDGLSISLIRVTESIELIEQSIPYQRKTVRNESMSAEDPPVIIQAGHPGRQEITVRIVYHDGLEYSRQETRVTVIEAAQDEIVMIGVGATPGNVEFAGLLAYISGGNSVILRGSSIFPEQINTGSNLDHRVFSLSPTGSYLLYTRTTTDTQRFNSLWVISTNPGAEPQPLGVDNVLWAGWNPARLSRPQIAYTTGIATNLLPGWEANNDLWLGLLPASEGGPFNPEQLIEAYPATYGWWGGNYAWSPTGRYLAYSYADEVGIIDTEAEDEAGLRFLLHTFTEYNTRAEWVWVPSLSWSPDGRYLAFNRHAGDDPNAADFDNWVVSIETGIARPFAEQSGIWSHPQWSPPMESGASASQIAFLRATNPLDSLRSSYTLWLMDRDGSNAHQLYPPAGENSRFPREQQFMAWSATGRDIAFVYNDALYLLNLDSGEVRRITQDDNSISNPTWAPYGLAISDELPETEVVPLATSERPLGGILPGN
jgi:resuscitation-promoting factor RpfB